MSRSDAPTTTVRRITPAHRHFFFGYYDRPAISGDGRYHLALNPGFRDRPNNGNDIAPLGVVDLEDNHAWRILEPSPAWNWQMGPCAQWIGPDPARTFIGNVRNGARVFARLRDVHDGIVRDFDAPVYDVCSDGRFGISVNFARIHVCRQGYGYPDIKDPWAGQPAPDDDGLWHVDLSTGNRHLIVSLRQLAHTPSPEGTTVTEGWSLNAAAPRDNMHWINHIMVSPLGARIMFLHRWLVNGRWGNTRLFSCRPDGSELTLVNPGPGISHCDWLDESHILSWCQWQSPEWHYYLMDIRGGEPELLGKELFSSDGHCSFQPGSGGRWMLTDTYPDKQEKRTLILYNRETDTRNDLGRFHSPRAEQQPGDIRCDLHPRWSPSGNTITFDSIHEGHRAIYLADLSGCMA